MKLLSVLLAVACTAVLVPTPVVATSNDVVFVEETSPEVSLRGMKAIPQGINYSVPAIRVDDSAAEIVVDHTQTSSAARGLRTSRRLAGETCPYRSTNPGTSAEGLFICDSGWRSDCTFVCAQTACYNSGGVWAALDPCCNPYRCFYGSLCPVGWTQGAKTQHGQTCTRAANDPSCHEDCARKQCQEHAGEWAGFDPRYSPFTCYMGAVTTEESAAIDDEVKGLITNLNKVKIQVSGAKDLLADVADRSGDDCVTTGKSCTIVWVIFFFQVLAEHTVNWLNEALKSKNMVELCKNLHKGAASTAVGALAIKNKGTYAMEFSGDVTGLTISGGASFNMIWGEDGQKACSTSGVLGFNLGLFGFGIGSGVSFSPKAMGGFGTVGSHISNPDECLAVGLPGVPIVVTVGITPSNVKVQDVVCLFKRDLPRLLTQSIGTKTESMETWKEAILEAAIRTGSVLLGISSVGVGVGTGFDVADLVTFKGSDWIPSFSYGKCIETVFHCEGGGCDAVEQKGKESAQIKLKHNGHCMSHQGKHVEQHWCQNLEDASQTWGFSAATERIENLACPKSYTQGELGKNGMVCTKGWTPDCQTDCAKHLCESQGGTWAGLDPCCNPFTCYMKTPWCLDFDYWQGTQVIMHPCHDKNNQKWYHDGTTIRTRHDTNKCLTFDSGRLTLKTCGAAHQQFSWPNEFWASKGGAPVRHTPSPHCPVSLSGKPGLLSSWADLGSCLDVEGTHSGEVPAMRTCSGGNGEKWKYDVYKGEITSIHASKCLDWDTNTASKVLLWVCTGGKNQRWYRKDKTVRNKQKGDGFCLDTKNGKAELLACDSSATQNWNWQPGFWP
ncbi:Ricin b lectin [Seminavis robusta]|uniref:Ricin b lectin n=1 Tax=Seminavis robusta TaxID=568900 RepID=A0A9N8DK90_9STRA|nr:Ricin b lectin [Seminavis robusta]|eukprot:Sro204_g085960.1 Ricin b lectin (838) ;mRNA; r:54671-57800